MATAETAPNRTGPRPRTRICSATVSVCAAVRSSLVVRLPVPPGVLPRAAGPRAGPEGEGSGGAGERPWRNPGAVGEGCPLDLSPAAGLPQPPFARGRPPKVVSAGQWGNGCARWAHSSRTLRAWSVQELCGGCAAISSADGYIDQLYGGLGPFLLVVIALNCCAQ